MPPVSSARPVRQSGRSARTIMARRENGGASRKHQTAPDAKTAYKRALMGDGWGDRYCTLRDMRDSAPDSSRQIADGRRTGRLVLLLSAICCLLSAEGFGAYSSRDLFIPIFGRGVGGDGRRYETAFTLTN